MKKNIFILYIYVNLQIALMQQIPKSYNKMNLGPIQYIQKFDQIQKNINYNITVSTNTKDNILNSFNIDPTLSYKNKYNDIYTVVVNCKPLKLFSRNNYFILNKEDTYKYTHEVFKESSIYQILRIIQLNVKRKTSNVMNSFHTYTDKALRVTQRDYNHKKISLDLLNKEIKRIDTCINTHHSYSKHIFTVGANVAFLLEALNHTHIKNSLYFMPYVNLNIKNILLTFSGFLNKNGDLIEREKNSELIKKLFFCIFFKQLREFKLEISGDYISKNFEYLFNVLIIKNLYLGAEFAKKIENLNEIKNCFKELSLLQFNVKYIFTLNNIKFEIKFITPNFKKANYHFGFWEDAEDAEDQTCSVISLKIKYTSKKPPIIPVIDNLDINI